MQPKWFGLDGCIKLVQKHPSSSLKRLTVRQSSYRPSSLEPLRRQGRLAEKAATTRMKHVIIGGLGGLGRHMQRKLLSEGKQVCVIDRATRSDVLKKNLLAHPTYVEYVPCNIGSNNERNEKTVGSSELTRAVLGADTVYSMVTPDIEKATVKDMKRTNVEGIGHIINACKEAGASKLVYVSSIAVTGQHKPSVEQTEDCRLPSHDEYENGYDLTKRLGEDAILDACSSDLRTCAIRPGGIMSGADDYFFRRIPKTPGVVYTVDRSPLDVISAKDLSRALFSASLKLGEPNSDLIGRSVFVTKCRSNSPVNLYDISAALSNRLGWRVTKIPSPVLSFVQAGLWSIDVAGKFMGTSNDDDTKLALPMHKTLAVGKHQQSFDNSLARDLLDFEPEETWVDTLEWVARDIERSNPDLFEATNASRSVLNRAPL